MFKLLWEIWKRIWQNGLQINLPNRSISVGLWLLIVRPKKEKCCVAPAPQVEFQKKLGQSVGRSNFIKLFFFKAPKTLLGVFSNIFLKKKHPIWAKLGAFRTIFLNLYFWLGSVAEGNTTFFFLALPCLRPVT